MLWCARPAGAFAWTGLPGPLLGPYRVRRDGDRLELRRLGLPDRVLSAGNRLWLVEGDRLWSATIDRPRPVQVELVSHPATTSLVEACSATGAPLAGAVVATRGGQRPPRRGGSWLLPADETLYVCAPNHVPEPFVVRAGEGEGRVRSFRLWRAVELTGRLLPPPPEGTRLHVDTRHGRRTIALGRDGRFGVPLLPEGRATLALDPAERALAAVPFGCDLRPPCVDLGAIHTQRRRTIRLATDVALEGPLWVRPGDALRSASRERYLEWPTIRAERVGERLFAFELVGPWRSLHAEVWNADGWTGQVPLTPLPERARQPLVHARCTPPGTLVVDLRGTSVDRLGLVACPDWVGRAGRAWGLVRRGRAWLPVQRRTVAPGTPKRVEGLQAGRWSLAVSVADSGVVLARASVRIEAGRVARWTAKLPATASLVLVAGVCRRCGAAGRARIAVRYDAGEAPRVVDVANTPVALTGLPAGARIELRRRGPRHGESPWRAAVRLRPGERRTLHVPCASCADPLRTSGVPAASGGEPFLETPDPFPFRRRREP